MTIRPNKTGSSTATFVTELPLKDSMLSDTFSMRLNTESYKESQNHSVHKLIDQTILLTRGEIMVATPTSHF
jgi:hypothetical protein